MTGNGGRYFEIDGILEQLTKRWSGRSIEVTEHMDALAAEFLERYGREPTQVELRRAVVRSRPAQDGDREDRPPPLLARGRRIPRHHPGRGRRAAPHRSPTDRGQGRAIVTVEGLGRQA